MYKIKEIEIKRIRCCDYCDLPLKRDRISIGEKIIMFNGDWFKFCDDCIKENGIKYLIEYMYKDV